MSFIASNTRPELVLMALVFTLAVFISLTIYVCIKSVKFTISGGILTIGITVVILFSIFSIIFPNKVNFIFNKY